MLIRPIEWGLYVGEDLLATVRAVVLDGAIAAFWRLPAHIRRGVEPCDENVRPKR